MLIWLIFCVGVGRGVLFVCMCAKVCVRLIVSVFEYVLSLAHTYIHISAQIFMACIFTRMWRLIKRKDKEINKINSKCSSSLKLLTGSESHVCLKDKT